MGLSRTGVSPIHPKAPLELGFEFFQIEMEYSWPLSTQTVTRLLIKKWDMRKL